MPPRSRDAETGSGASDLRLPRHDNARAICHLWQTACSKARLADTYLDQSRGISPPEPLDQIHVLPRSIAASLHRSQCCLGQKLASFFGQETKAVRQPALRRRPRQACQ